MSIINCGKNLTYRGNICHLGISLRKIHLQLIISKTHIKTSFVAKFNHTTINANNQHPIQQMVKNLISEPSTTSTTTPLLSTTDQIIYDSCETIHGTNSEFCKKFYEEHPEQKPN